MPIVIAGYLDFDPNRAEQMIRDAKPYIDAALAEPGCVAYTWAIDPLKPGRVHVFEEWENEAALAGHFSAASYADMGGHLRAVGILGFDVKKYRVDLIEPVYDEAGVPRADFFTEKRA